MKTKYLSFLLLGSVLVAGCGQKAVEVTSTASTEIPASSTPVNNVSAAVIDPASAGTIKGKVLFEGTVPPAQEISVRGNPECAVFHQGGKVKSEELVVNNGALQNVFVYVKEGLEGKSFPAPSEAVTIQNKSCVYVPHVSGAQVGQSIILLNEDPTLHNIHSYSKNSKSWNLGLPFQGMKQTKKFEAAEVMVHLKCDVHPWMSGYVGVLSHPYFSVSGADGSFEIKNLPPGEYLIEAWQEKLGVQSQKIKIEPQETKELEFKFTA